jgi:hypothetical protein
MRFDPLMPELVLVEHPAEFPRDVQLSLSLRSRGIPCAGISPSVSRRSFSIAACASTPTVMPSASDWPN